MTGATAVLEAPHLAEDYNPRHDRDFKVRLLLDLIDHAGEWRPLGRLYAPEVASFERCCMVRDAIAYWRRHGYEIAGDRALGYKLVSGQLSLDGELA